MKAREFSANRAFSTKTTVTSEFGKRPRPSARPLAAATTRHSGTPMNSAHEAVYTESRRPKVCVGARGVDVSADIAMGRRLPRASHPP